MTVVECFLLFEVTVERGENAFCGECRGEREVAASEPLGETKEIWEDIFLFACKQGSRTSEAGHHLVQNEKNIGLVAELSQIPQKPLRPYSKTGSPLNKRLDDHCCDVPLFKNGSKRGEIADVSHGKVVSGDAFLKCADSTKVSGSERVTMVGVIKGDEARAMRGAGLEMKLDSHFHGRFDGRRSVVTKKNAGESLLREERGQARGEFDGRGICAAKEGDMGHAVELLAKGSVDRWVGVAVDVSPD